MLGDIMIAEVLEMHNTDCPVWCSQAPKILHNLIRHLIMVHPPAVHIVVDDTSLLELARFTWLTAIIHLWWLDISAKFSKFSLAPKNVRQRVFI
jgi:hypothetical protein